MNNKKLEKLIGQKSSLLLDAYMLMDSENNKDCARAKQLMSKAAPLEEKIGDELALRGRVFDASINYLSAGTCYRIVEQLENSTRTYNKILNSALKHPGIIPEKTVQEASKYIK